MVAPGNIHCNAVVASSTTAQSLPQLMIIVVTGTPTAVVRSMGSVSSSAPGQRESPEVNREKWVVLAMLNTMRRNPS
ncbi:hypothetical protein GCM10009706_05800 [Curtobacterium citreum]|uniref:Uncharacterized protein n=1 Tax=Curtobacterium luteum TaxID=33881 RepID=A0A8H9G9A6_9MICO|nr:hypothetical protein GCM10009769_04580 [Curtobacterium luteum]GGL70277.1 hypothetical protein GCM10009706_05800 [Curtobacterium citreum]